MFMFLQRVRWFHHISIFFFSQELKTRKEIARTIFHSVIAFRFETICKSIPCETLAVDNKMKV